MDAETKVTLKAIHDDVKDIKRSVDKINDRLRKNEITVGAHDESIETLKKQPSATKAIVVVTTIFSFIIGLALFLSQN